MPVLPDARLPSPARRRLAACVAAALVWGGCTAPVYADARGLPVLASRGAGLVAMPAAVPQPDKSRNVPRVPDHPATNIVVSNCDDSGSGSLRDAAAIAGADDVIDLTQLSCSTITLTTGYIPIYSNPFVNGPGAAALTIDGNHQSGVIQQLAGAGTLVISSLTIANGYYVSSDAPRGGCLYSVANIMLQESVVRDCSAIGTGSTPALGGGIYARGYVSLSQSVVSGNAVIASSGANARGGGVYTKGDLFAPMDSLGNNVAYSSAASGDAGAGGAVFALGQAFFYESTVYQNHAQSVGGIVIGGVGATGASSIFDSTVSGNTSVASVYGAGVYVAAALQLDNSTITGNVTANGANTKYGAGLSLGEAATADIESSIVFGNVLNEGSSAPADDIGGHTKVALSGASNLINFSTLTVPADTIDSDPQLMPLTDNGGPTLTHAIPATSPAIDAGNTVRFQNTDQRGNGYPRVSGARADIGAYEFQVPADTIFRDGFD